MWLRDLVDYMEAKALKLSQAINLPSAFMVIALSFWESVYCALHRFFASEIDSQGRIDEYIRAHRLVYETKPESPRVAIVTGANSGIGLETATALGRAGHTTILACRNYKRGQKALEYLQKITGLQDTFVLMELDLASFMSIEKFATDFEAKYKTLHVLACNAGMAFTYYDTTYDGIEAQFGTNYVGHYVLVNRLLNTMKKSGPARITIASSIAACMIPEIDYTRVTDVWRFSRFGNYAISKLAMLVYSNALARQLKDTEITVNAYHPGLVATGLYRNMTASMLPGIYDFRNWLWLDQRTGSTTSIYLALSPELDGQTGGYYAREQPAAMHPEALDRNAQERLCKFTSVLVSTNTHAPNVLASLNKAASSAKD